MAGYPGLYRAKVAKTNGVSATVFVPQVFGEEPIIVRDSIGDLPSAPDMGWVFFQAGNAEFPVWMGKFASATDGGGGGEGVNEVWVGPDDPIPANPTIELWYDQDAPAGVFGSLPPGGTIGQVLTKNSGTSYDTIWTTLIRTTSGVEAAKPTVPAAGSRYFATDTWRDWLFDGVGWIIMEEPWQTFNSVIGATTGTITTVGAKSFTYRRSNGNLFWDADVIVTTIGSAAGALSMTLPFAVPSGSQYIGAGRENQTTGNMLQVTAIGSTAFVNTYNNLFPGGNGMRLIMSGHYRMQTGYS